MCVLAIGLALGMVIDAPLPSALRKELEPLQGFWHIIKAEKNGMTADFDPLGAAKALELEIKDNRWIFTGKDKGRIVGLGVNGESKWLDVRSIEPGRAGKVDEAIYRIEGDRLTVCLYQGEGRRRPTEFKSADAETILITLQRPK
jgi:uncharacterized protein (TIGR03067 family)